jgi:hypothetical protein
MWLLTSSCLSIHMQQLGSHWVEFHKTLYYRIFQKSVKNNQVLLKSHKNTKYFTWRPMYIYGNISMNSPWNEKYFKKNTVKKLRHTFYFQEVIFKLYHLWQVEKTQNVWCISTATMVMQMHQFVKLNVHCLSCLIVRLVCDQQQLYEY